MNARDKRYDESLNAALRDPVEAAAYLEAAINMDDPAALLLALRQVAEAHGMAEVARHDLRQDHVQACSALQRMALRR